MSSKISSPISLALSLNKKRKAVEVLFPFNFEIPQKVDLVFLI